MVNTADAAHCGVQCQAVVYSWFYLIILSVANIPGTYLQTMVQFAFTVSD